MNSKTRTLYSNLSSTDDKDRLDAFNKILSLTDSKVPWVYEVWDDLLLRLGHPNSYQKSIAIMLLCNLVKSDTDQRISQSIETILEHTKDEKFITSRRCIQNIWKVAAAAPDIRQKVIDHLEMRFKECASEKHFNLLRTDIIQSIRSLYDFQPDENLRELGKSMIKEENESKYRKKYEAILFS